MLCGIVGAPVGRYRAMVGSVEKAFDFGRVVTGKYWRLRHDASRTLEVSGFYVACDRTSMHVAGTVTCTQPDCRVAVNMPSARVIVDGTVSASTVDLDSSSLIAKG